MNQIGPADSAVKMSGSQDVREVVPIAVVGFPPRNSHPEIYLGVAGTADPGELFEVTSLNIKGSQRSETICGFTARVVMAR
jgi:hypothetical protein